MIYMLEIYKENEYKEDDEYLDDLDLLSDIDEEDYIDENYNEEIAKAFAKDMEKFLYSIIAQDEILEEEFVSPHALRMHFNKHCKGHSDKKSTRGRILYDFTDNSQYVEYERNLSRKINETDYTIGSLWDYDTVIKYMRKLFEGNIVVWFTNGCDLNNHGTISVAFNAFSSNVTRNYHGGNTIDICIKKGNKRTISLYAVDAQDVEKRLNSTIGRYSDYDGEPFRINP